MYGHRCGRGRVRLSGLLVPRKLLGRQHCNVLRGVLRDWRWSSRIYERHVCGRVHMRRGQLLRHHIQHCGGRDLHRPIFLHRRHGAARGVRDGGVLLCGRFPNANTDRLRCRLVWHNGERCNHRNVGVCGVLHMRRGQLLPVTKHHQMPWSHKEPLKLE